MFKQNAKIPLRFGEQAENILTDWTAATSADLCWDKEWECLLTLDWANEQLTVTAHRSKDKKRIVHPLPKWLYYGSRLFRYQNSICLLAGDENMDALLRLPRLGATVVRQGVSKSTDLDAKIAPEKTKKRREVLMELHRNIPLTMLNDTHGGRIYIEEHIPYYPVVVGYPNESDIRFSATGRSIAIGSVNHLVVAWLVGSSWQTVNFKKEIPEKIYQGRKEYIFLRSYNAFANDRYVTFGIEAIEDTNIEDSKIVDTKSAFFTLVVELNGNQARVHRLFETMYAPPIRTVE